MKKTKSMPIILTAMITAAIFAATVITSCTKSTPDPCASVTCYNGGICTQGTCSCATGYSGTNCQTAANAAFAGTWTGTICNGNSAYYTITTSSNPLSFTFPVSFGLSCGSTNIDFTATIEAGTQTFSTNTFTVTDNCGNRYAMNAAGSIAGNSINITFITAGSAGTSTCIFNGTK